MKRNAMIVLGVFMAAGSAAVADEVLQIDVNGLTAEVSGDFSETFTGTMSVFNTPAMPDVDGDAEILDVLVDGTAQGTGGAATGAFAFDMALSFSSGMLTGGSITVAVDQGASENSYSASVAPSISGAILDIGGGTFLIGGVTFDGLFADAAGTFLGVDITRWGDIQPVPGSFAQIAFEPNGNNTDADTDVDVFVAIPTPAGAAMAGLGLVGLTTRRRRG